MEWPPSASRSSRSAVPKVELRLRGASELWAGAVAGTRPDGASPPLCSAVVAGPMAFSLLERSPSGAAVVPWPSLAA